MLYLIQYVIYMEHFVILEIQKVILNNIYWNIMLC